MIARSSASRSVGAAGAAEGALAGGGADMALSS
jgi:hypothetical protein